MLYALNKHEVDILAETFPDLKHKLADHAEDYEKTTATTTVQIGIAAAVRASKLTASIQEDAGTGQLNDPLHKVHDHLQQQDGKMALIDMKLNQQEGQLHEMSKQIEQLVSLVGQLATQQVTQQATQQARSAQP
eukprot:COSAG01_NODE_1158_length_11469_cov_101.645646_8_plen_134_part_00